VIKTRQHWAALKPQEKGIILEVLRFPEELVDAAEFKLPLEKAASAPEISMASKLVESMTGRWNPEGAPALERPTTMVFDLDPGAPADMFHCCQVGLNFEAADLIKRLEKRGDLFAPVLSLKQQLPKSL
jgi:hypothetical protein